MPEACSFIKNETQAQVFSCEFCEIFKNTFFTEHPRTTASVEMLFKADLWQSCLSKEFSSFLQINIAY